MLGFPTNSMMNSLSECENVMNIINCATMLLKYFIEAYQVHFNLIEKSRLVQKYQNTKAV